MVPAQRCGGEEQWEDKRIHFYVNKQWEILKFCWKFNKVCSVHKQVCASRSTPLTTMHLCEAQPSYCLSAQSWNLFIVCFLLLCWQFVELSLLMGAVPFFISVPSEFLCWNRDVNLADSLLFLYEIKLIFRQPSLYILNVFHFNMQWYKLLLGYKIREKLTSLYFFYQKWCTRHIAGYLTVTYICYHFVIELVSYLNSKRC